MLDLLVATSSKSKPRVNECEKIDQEARLEGRVACVFFFPLHASVLALFPTYRVQHSRPATSVSTRSFSLLAHVGSPDISTLHSTEPTFPRRSPIVATSNSRMPRQNLIHDYWGVIPFCTTTPAHHDQRQCTQARPAPNTYQIPVSATR